MERHVLYDTTEGTPQGGIISPVLANLALDGLEAALQRAFPRRGRKRGGTTTTPQVNLIRYADDFVITGRTKELLEQEVRPLVDAFLRARGLELSPEKTAVTHIEDGFDFLGQHVRKYHGKSLIKPSKDSVKGHLATVRAVIKADKQAPAGTLLAQLTPLIRGWAGYHRHQGSKKVFSPVDAAIFKALWRWAKRRHPNKGARWVRAKYFPTVGDRHRLFTGSTVDRDGASRARHLFRADSVPITRHVKVRGAANPHDPAWEPYFEARLGVKMEATLAGRRRLLHLWQRQAGRCPRRNHPIDTLTGWHVHHVIWRSRGGSDKAANLALLHPTCHGQHHAREHPVVEPRPPEGALREA